MSDFFTLFSHYHFPMHSRRAFLRPIDLQYMETNLKICNFIVIIAHGEVKGLLNEKKRHEWNCLFQSCRIDLFKHRFQNIRSLLVFSW